MPGCGGGSAGSGEKGTEPTGPPGPPAASADSSTPAGQASPAGHSQASPAAGVAPAPTGSGPQSHKHGQRVAIPKGPAEPAPSTAQRAQATVADMALQSPSLQASAEGPPRLPATYTCDGRDSWPELRWDGVPADTKELALFAMSVQPVEERLFFDWALAGLDPGLRAIEAGRLPKGAVIGQNSFGKAGYSICPQGSGEVYLFALYALPQRLSAKRGFEPRAFRQEVLDASGDVGLLAVAYVRG